MIYSAETLHKLTETLSYHDEVLVEEAYNKLFYDGFDYDKEEELVKAIHQMVLQWLNEPDNTGMEQFQYDMRERMLAGAYQKVDAHDVYGFIFTEDTFQVCDEVDTKNGVGNGIRMDIYTRWYVDNYGRKHGVDTALTTVVTEDLRALYVYPKHIYKNTIKMSNFNLNSYYGRKRVTRSIDKIYGLIIDLDDVTSENQINALIEGIHNDKLPRPAFLINSGHGFHVYYVLDNPICFHDRSFDIYPVITNILNGLRDSITSYIGSKNNESLDINKGYTIIGTHNRKNKRLIVTAYKVTGDRCSLKYLRGYIDKPYDDKDYDISFPKRTQYSKYEAARLYPKWAVTRFPELFSEEERQKLLTDIGDDEQNSKKKYVARENIKDRKYSVCNIKLYRWFLKLISDPSNIHHGNRYKSMVGLAIYGVKCGVSQEQVREDLISLLPMFNSVEKKNQQDGHFEMGISDINNALQVYKKERTNLYTFKWIMDFTEINYEKACTRNHLPQGKHLENARDIRDEKYPNGSWRANSEGRTKAKIYEFIKENPESGINSCIEACGCSKSYAYRYWEQYRSELGLDREISNHEKIQQYRTQHPNATKADCIRELRLSKPTVYKYWEQKE